MPGFPLPEPTERELEVWAQVWRLPQGCMWSRLSHQWLLLTLGVYVRQVVKCESPVAGAAQLAQLHRFADQVGMSHTGLAAHGFKVADLEPAPEPQERRAGSRQRVKRLRAVPEGDAS